MTQINASQPAPQPKMSVLAILSLVSGIAGFCVAFIGPILGLIFGTIAIVQINNSSGRLKGQGIAIAGVAVSVFTLLTSCLMIGIMLPALSAARDAARTVQFSSQMRQVGMAMIDYANDNDGRLPDASTWPDDLVAQGTSAELFTSAHFPNQGRAMAMNSTLSGANLDAIESPYEVVLLFEVKPGQPTSGGMELLPDKSRGGTLMSDTTYVVLFADGHVEMVDVELIDSYVWAPKGGSSNGPAGGGGFISPE